MEEISFSPSCIYHFDTTSYSYTHHPVSSNRLDQPNPGNRNNNYLTWALPLLS